MAWAVPIKVVELRNAKRALAPESLTRLAGTRRCSKGRPVRSFQVTLSIADISAPGRQTKIIARVAWHTDFYNFLQVATKRRGTKLVLFANISR
jgi:hypothetical protein